MHNLKIGMSAMAKKRSSSFYISVYITSVDWCASDILAGHDFSVA